MNGYKALANNNLTKLEYLSLKDNYIRNEGAKALANGNFTKLQHLILTEGVGDEVRKKLEKS
ncbi:hypothetical protein [Wolbachia endosymbiont of Zygogramma bicolorata]|uniref:hypothetical protein n=1 Tax=Wolbachia endosymbiont of Zygogramma bicolorata TaxID=3134048 RepID=UPI003DA81FA8